MGWLRVRGDRANSCNPRQQTEGGERRQFGLSRAPLGTYRGIRSAGFAQRAFIFARNGFIFAVHQALRIDGSQLAKQREQSGRGRGRHAVCGARKYLLEGHTSAPKVRVVANLGRPGVRGQT
ncbi:MAG: hypothetical protein JO020_23620 [Chloroflexi bacterium]|nr:hypothetical protein [Chloroflexota bacterium]